MIDWLNLLGRIGVTDTAPTVQTLQQLQRQALLTLPFENLDIHLGRPIFLDHASIHERLLSAIVVVSAMSSTSVSPSASTRCDTISSAWKAVLSSAAPVPLRSSMRARCGSMAYVGG
jgi:hypothetical protein